jgi:hypothetical protein
MRIDNPSEVNWFYEIRPFKLKPVRPSIENDPRNVVMYFSNVKLNLIKLLWTPINSELKGRYACGGLICAKLTKKSLPVRIHAILSNAGWLQRSCFYQGGSSSNSKIPKQCQIFNDNSRLKRV